MAILLSNTTSNLHALPKRQKPSTPILTLFKADLLHNTSECYVTLNEVQTLPELRGTTKQTLIRRNFMYQIKLQLLLTARSSSCRA